MTRPKLGKSVSNPSTELLFFALKVTFEFITISAASLKRFALIKGRDENI